MTTQTEALNIAIDYMNERLEDHDAKYQRHPATESERNNILADIETVAKALAQPIIKSYLEKDNSKPEQKPAVFLKEWSDWRDMVVVNIMRHGSIDKHLARELANHFQSMTPQLKEPEQEQFALKHRIAELEGAVIGLQAQRKPLTDDEIWKFWCSRPEVPEGEDDSMEAEFVAAVRAVLAANGIKE